MALGKRNKEHQEAWIATTDCRRRRLLFGSCHHAERHEYFSWLLPS